jgi:hypothetical protein
MKYLPWLVVTSTAALLGGLLTPAQAYEEDTHFTMTFVQCRAAGLTDAEALTVATYDQGMDDSAGTVANSGIIPRTTEEQLWHSIPKNGTAVEVLARKSALWNEVLGETDPQKRLQRLGVFFHYQQDTWAHRHHPNAEAQNFRPYSVPFGHAADGHQPDRPPFDPVCALRCLEEGIGYARAIVTVLNRTPNALFQNYQPAKGTIDSGWSDSRKGKHFNQLSLDSSTPARNFLTGLIHAQINAYTSSIDANPNYFGRYTADEAKYASVRTSLQPLCSTQNITIPPSRTPLTTLTTAQLQQGGIASARIDDVLLWNNGKAYFFQGSSYIRYDVAADKADAGFPQPISRFWKGVYPDGFDASLLWNNGKAYFFKGDSYIRYDVAKDQVDPGFPQPTSRFWKGIWTNKIDAAVLWNNGKAYFFKGDSYIRYDLAKNQADPGFPQKISNFWKGVFSDGIDAVVLWNNGKAYFFKGDSYIRYDLAKDQADPGFPQPIARFWSGIRF